MLVLVPLIVLMGCWYLVEGTLISQGGARLQLRHVDSLSSPSVKKVCPNVALLLLSTHEDKIIALCSVPESVSEATGVKAGDWMTATMVRASQYSCHQEGVFVLWSLSLRCTRLQLAAE